MRGWPVELPERHGEYRREELYGAGQRFPGRDWPVPSEAPMVRRRGVTSPEHYSRKRPRFLEPSGNISTQGPMERRGGGDFGLPSRFLAHLPMEWSPERYDERCRLDDELSRPRISEGTRPWTPPVGERWRLGSSPPGRHHEFLEQDWSSPPGRHHEVHREFSRTRISEGARPWMPSVGERWRRGEFLESDWPLPAEPPSGIDRDNGFGMPMERCRERSSPRTFDGRRPWTPPPRDCDRQWGGMSPDRPPRCFEVTRRSPGTRRRVTEEGPHSWTAKSQVSPVHSAGLIQSEHGGGGGGGGTLPRRFLSEKRGIQQAVQQSSGGGGQQKSHNAADPVNSVLIEEKPKPQAKIAEETGIVGTCGDTQKGFFRLTGPADPSKIRPKAVLVEALMLLQASDRDYSFKSDQLKSIRQDLYVQNIEDDFAVQVYEFHARLALSNRDMSELNVCLTRLHEHYQKKLNDQSGEFMAYDILLSATQGKKIELMSKLGRLPNSLKQDEAVKHAKKVTQSIRSGNYVQFFKLYKAAPNLNGQLMVFSFEKIRFEALKCMSKAYTQKIPVSYIANILGFHGTKETVDWLQSHGAVICSDENGEALMPKESAPTQPIPDVTPDAAGFFESVQSIKTSPSGSSY